MTEKEWLSCEDPLPMLTFLNGRISHRKQQLFAVACCLRIDDLIPTDASKECVLTTERYADGAADEPDLERAVEASIAACSHEQELRRQRGSPWSLVDVQAINAVSRVHRERGEGAAHAAASARAWDTCLKKAWAGEPGYAVEADDFSLQLQDRTFRLERAVEYARQADILRDLLGPLPFRTTVLDQNWLAWNNGTVLKLAQAVYDERAFDRLAILADALEESGCTNQDILEHCRRSAVHVRGCWVVDLLRGAP
jgi:hypothetical protein